MIAHQSRQLSHRGRARALAIAGAAAVTGVLASGCGSASRSLSTTSEAAATNPAATTSPAATGGGMAAMPGMQTSASSPTGSGRTVAGIKPIPTQTLASADWQQMKITARAMTAVPFVIFNGESERTVKVPRDVSFHLMVSLDDSRSGYPIPYAGVWATIRKAGRIVFDERQWPMLSEYMGPHYGNNVALPGPGTYQLSLLISPPVAARHMEYKNVWTSPHRVTATFHWSGA